MARVPRVPRTPHREPKGTKGDAPAPTITAAAPAPAKTVETVFNINNVELSPRSPYRDDAIITLTAVGIVLLIGAYFFSRESIPTLLILGVIICLGFGLPRWIGLDERKNRARKAKADEKAKWGFHSRDREGAWINYIDFPLIVQADMAKGKFFYSEWLIIHDGTIVVNPGSSSLDPNRTEVIYNWRSPRTYAWDGCTPKRLFYWLALIGTPDWWERREALQTLDEKGHAKTKDAFWPQAHYASLVHDALYQYLGLIPIPKQDVDQHFHDMLLDSGFPAPLAKLYHYVVRHFGARKIKEDQAGPNTTLKSSGFPLPPPGKT